MTPLFILVYLAGYLFAGFFILGIAKGLEIVYSDEQYWVFFWPFAVIIALLYIIYRIPYEIGRGLINLFTPDGK